MHRIQHLFSASLRVGIKGFSNANTLRNLKRSIETWPTAVGSLPHIARQQWARISSNASSVLGLRFEILDLLLGLFLADAITFLDLAHQFFALAGNHIEVVVGQLAPLRLNLAVGARLKVTTRAR